jgi:hypothetical protein
MLNSKIYDYEKGSFSFTSDIYLFNRLPGLGRIRTKTAGKQHNRVGSSRECKTYSEGKIKKKREKETGSSQKNKETHSKTCQKENP